jgi:glycosyltransferase involved in cell wall biosynthesis
MAPDALLVLFVGWVRREKGITELVDAIRQLRDQGERVHLLVLGDDHVPGDLDPSTQTALDIERGFHRVRWTQDTAPYYLAADIVVLPSWREGFPRVVLEAAAAGKPVVTTDVTGCRDSVEPGATGLLVPVRDTSALVQSLKRLIVDDQLRIEMGVRARQRVYSKYSQSAVWEGTELLLRRIACAQDR